MLIPLIFLRQYAALQRAKGNPWNRESVPCFIPLLTLTQCFRPPRWGRNLPQCTWWPSLTWPTPVETALPIRDTRFNKRDQVGKVYHVHITPKQGSKYVPAWLSEMKNGTFLFLHATMRGKNKKFNPLSNVGQPFTKGSLGHAMLLRLIFYPFPNTAKCIWLCFLVTFNTKKIKILYIFKTHFLPYFISFQLLLTIKTLTTFTG